MSPLAVLHAYRKKAVALGARFMEGEVAAITRAGDRVTGVALASGERLSAPSVVNAAGPWASQIALTAGVALPISPTKRQVTTVEVAARPERILPALFLPSGLAVYMLTSYLIGIGQQLYVNWLDRKGKNA